MELKYKHKEIRIMKKNTVILAITLTLLGGCLIGCGTTNNNEAENAPTIEKEIVEEATPTTEEEDVTEMPEETSEEDTSNAGNGSKVAIDIENYGVITVELDENAAPITVKNFLELINEGFYDGLTFHRIMNGFMMQGGDPTATGMGGSDKEIKGEFANNGVDNPLSHTRGAISMARSMEPDSASSQFFIVHEDSTFLDGEYAAFGYVTDGMDIVDAICAEAAVVDDNGTVEPGNQPIITSIKVIG